jgi:hypothetical protein
MTIITFFILAFTFKMVIILLFLYLVICHGIISNLQKSTLNLIKMLKNQLYLITGIESNNYISDVDKSLHF